MFPDTIKAMTNEQIESLKIGLKDLSQRVQAAQNSIEGVPEFEKMEFF